MSTRRVWVTDGFDGFRTGTFGNAGHNLYVSRAGVLQRIHQYDLDGDGYVDLVFSNSHDYWETAPALLHRWAPDGRFASEELWTVGATAAAVLDLNGDGALDLVVARQFDGVSLDVNATIFYGSARGWGEHAIQYLPAPGCVALAAGDFDGDGRPDLAFALADRVRVFRQGDLAFERTRFEELPIASTALAASDLDGDGCADLIVRESDGTIRVLWGGSDGLTLERSAVLAIPGGAGAGPRGSHGDHPDNVMWHGQLATWSAIAPTPPVPGVLQIDGVARVVVCTPERVALVPIATDRSPGTAIELECADVHAVAMGDIDGDGIPDLVLAVGGTRADAPSWICWGGADGWSLDRATPLAVGRAADVAIGDLDGDGRPEVVFARSHDADSFTVTSPVFAVDGRAPRLIAELAAHDPRRALLVADRRDEPPGILLLSHYGRSVADRNEVDIYFGGPDGYGTQRHLALPAWGACDAVCVDFDDDGRVDLVLANAAESERARAPGSYVYRNLGPGFVPQHTQTVPPLQPQGIACADLDRDGYLDLVFAATAEAEITIVPGGPNGFEPERARVVKLEIGRDRAELRFIQLLDLNGDGWLDLFVPIIDSDQSLILWGGPDGFRGDRFQRLAVWHACSAQAADLDGDGRLDLVVGGHTASNSGPHDSFAYVYWNGPDGLREDRRTLLPGEAINSIAIADFDNDGHLDVYVGSYQDGRKRRDIDSYIYWNRGGPDGRGLSSRDFTRLFSHSASGHFAADLNEDGWIDLVVANHKTYGDHVCDSTIWWNGPDGFDERRVTNLPTRGPHGMVTPGPANILDRGPEEFYVSALERLAAGERIATVDWEGDLGPKTWVRAEVRVAARGAELGAASWTAPADARRLDGGGYVQYRLALGATNSGSTPRIRRVVVAFDAE